MRRARTVTSLFVSALQVDLETEQSLN